jgi:hypothetical protein
MNPGYYPSNYFGVDYWGLSYWGSKAIVASVNVHVGGGSFVARAPIKKRVNPQIAQLIKEYLELKLNG